MRNGPRDAWLAPHRRGAAAFGEDDDAHGLSRLPPEPSPPGFLARLGRDVRLPGADQAAGDDPPGERALLAPAGLSLGTEGGARLRDLAEGLRARLYFACGQRRGSGQSAHGRARCRSAGPGPRRPADGHARVRNGARPVRPSGRLAPPADPARRLRSAHGLPRRTRRTTRRAQARPGRRARATASALRAKRGGGTRAARGVARRPRSATAAHDPRRACGPRRVPWRARPDSREARRSDRMTQATTIGALRETSYRPKTVKQELRGNLISALAAKNPIFEGIVGYETTVIPQIENALLSGQDIILLGERGQAKTRIARKLIELLDKAVPAIAGCEINDEPFAPICAACKYRIANDGDSVELVWLTPDQRYSEKLATPDISIADLIGEVDPIKVAEGRYLSDEMTIHYGLVPRTHRGIFTLNELPDLAERVQVGLLNVMEERDVQIRGYKVRLPLDLFVVASANPEDYTNRGRIITPLKDRFGSQIRTHYMKEVLAEISQLARRSPEISQRSGVSVRVTVANYENLASAALKRALRTGETSVVPRISDLPAVVASTAGKIELESVGEVSEERVIDRLVQRAVLNVFNRTFSLVEFDSLLAAFQRGATMHVSPTLSSQEYVKQALQIPGMKGAVAKVGATGNPAAIAAAVEFVLEGLHLNRKLNKERGETRSTFRA